MRVNCYGISRAYQYFSMAAVTTSRARIGARRIAIMNDYEVLRGSLRAKKARLALRIGNTGYDALLGSSVLAATISVLLYFYDLKLLSFCSLATAVALLIPALWYKNDLSKLTPNDRSLTDRLSGDILARLPVTDTLTPQNVWKALGRHWQTVFIAHHFMLDPATIEKLVSQNESDMISVWTEAARLANQDVSPAIEPGHVAAAIMHTSPNVTELFNHLKFSPDDILAVSAWLNRLLETMRAEKPYFGGIGRDWANGFTPRLNQYGLNISLAIERHGAHFGWLTASPGVAAIKNAFSKGDTAIALIGDPGVGKTSHINALAQVLLEERKDRNLEHRQVVALDPGSIVSSARHPGELESILLSLINETAHAGHIILFFDDAQLFFKSGPGSFDMTPILLPVLQARSIQIIMAMTPYDYQYLKVSNPSFANLLTPVQLQEPDEKNALRILEDTALTIEHAHKVLVSYEAIKESYRLSGRYMQDMSYPGKAIQLLEQSLSQSESGGIITAKSVQNAIEQSQGVKVGAAAPAEASALLSLEDHIHQRMINQVQAVSVVANALRRSRAGVASTTRPIGSFLFLGPTGVGKTELAKAVAATYFNDEQNMIRLDMSEYQQSDDVARLLSNGNDGAKSLIVAVRRQPFSVVLLDEIEKAHPNILNLLLQLLDEGQLTDSAGKVVSFKDCIVIATSNAGANTIRNKITQGERVEDLQDQLIDELINSGQFKPELLNRFDEIVLFRPLNKKELLEIARLMLGGVNKNLAAQNITVVLTQEALDKVVSAGYDPRLGARPMRRALQRYVENAIAGRILRGEVRPGDHVILDAPDLQG